MRKSKKVRFALLAATSLWSGPALAQQSAADANVASLGEIIVTANRRTESLQDVPLTVAAVSGEDLAAAGVGDTQGLEQVVPGLVVGRSATSVQPTIRGIGTRGSTPGEESNIAVYLDGVYQPAMTSNNFELLNVERVEVLKGPQGTLYGRNATGGAINVVTTKPGDEFTGKFTLSYGRYNEVKAGAYLVVPLADTLSADVAAKYVNRDGYVKDLIRGGKIGDLDSITVRGRLRWQPTDTIDIIAAISRTDTDDDSIFALGPVTGNSVGRRNDPTVVLPTGPRQYVGDRLPKSGFEQTDFSLTADFDLGPVLLQSATDYQKNNAYFATDSDGTTYQGGGVSTDDNPQKAFSQELRLISQGSGRFQWIVGGMFFDSKSQLNPLIIDTASFSGIKRDSGQESRALAGYVEGTYEAVDNLFLTGGLRYSWEKRTLFLPQSATRPERLTQSATFDDWTPRASIRYEINPRTSVYFTYAEGFKSGLFNGVATNVNNTPVRPETIRSYEAGIKLQPTPWLRANLSAFIYKYKDLQVQARLSGQDVAFLQNAGKADVKGIDFDAAISPSPGLNFTVGAEWLDSKYKDFGGAAVNIPTVVNGVEVGGNTSVILDVTGEALLRAPKFTANVGVNYEFDAGGGIIKLGANANYNDGYFHADLSNRLRQPSYVMVNASVGWWTQDEQFGITLWGENLADEDVLLYVLSTGNQDGFAYRTPAMYGLRVNFNF